MYKGVLLWESSKLSRKYRKKKSIILSTSAKRKPEGEVGGEISSVLKIFENKLPDELLYKGGGESPQVWPAIIGGQ